MRTPIIAGNWKMNKTNVEAINLCKDLIPLVQDVEHTEIIVCPTYTALSDVSKELKGSNIKLGAQDVHWEASGAFTSKISCDMLKGVGCEYVILGHSETRQYFNETDETVNKKVKAAIEAGLRPIVCVGELLEEREAEKTMEVIETQVKGAFEGVEDISSAVIAYEPVWAIGTGKTAAPEQAQEVHAFIRKLLTELYDEDTAANIRIQYGGSMKPENVSDLMGQADIDGGLIGGAALEAQSFSRIVKF